MLCSCLAETAPAGLHFDISGHVVVQMTAKGRSASHNADVSQVCLLLRQAVGLTSVMMFACWVGQRALTHRAGNIITQI